MADFQTTVELKAVTSKLNRKLDLVNQKLKGVSAQVKKTQSSMSKFTSKATRGFTKLNNKIRQSKAQIAGVGLSLGLVLGKGVKDFKEFEDGIAQIGTLGVTNLKQVEDQLDAVRKEFGVSGAEATKGYYDIISAGAAQGTEAMEQLIAATKLAKAGNTDLGGAIDVVTSGVNIFGGTGEDAASITDKLFLAVKYGKTTVEELGATFGFVAPVVAAAGLGMSDYAAAMATVTAGGIQTNQATTGLKAVLSNLIKVTPKAAKKAEELGLDFSAAALKSKGLVVVMQEIAEATGGDVTQLGQLFDSIEAINAVSVLTSDKGLKSLSRNFNEMSDSSGTTQEALDKVKESASFKFDKFNQSLSIMSKNIGGAVVPALLSLAESMAPVIDFLAALIEQNPGIIKVTAAIVAMGVAWAFLGAPFTILLAGATVAIGLLIEKFDLFADGGEAALERIKTAWNDFWEKFSSQTATENVINIADFITLNTEGWRDDITASFDKVVTGLKDYMTSIVWEDLWVGLKESLDKVGAWFNDLYIYLVGASVVPDLVEGVKSHFGDMIEFLRGVAGTAVFAELKAAFEGVKTSAQDMGLHASKSAIALGQSTSSVGAQKRQLQKLIQTYRELDAAHKNDLKNTKASAVERKLVMENSSKFEQRIIKERIAKSSTLGREVGKIQQGAAEAKIAKLVASLEGKLKGRGYMSRFMFGEGTLLTWEQKISGMMGRLGVLFTKIGQQVQGGVTKIQTALESKKNAKLTAKVADTGAKVKTVAAGTTGTTGAAAQNAKILSTLEAELKLTNANLAKSNASLLKIKEGSTTTARLMKGMGALSTTFGTTVRALFESMGKVMGGVSSALLTFKTSAAGAKIGASVTAIKDSKALKIMSKLFKKIIIVFAIFDAYKGFTDLDRASEIIGKEGDELTIGDKSISAIANAVGNFFSGFAHLAGYIVEYMGGDKLAEYLKTVDLAPEFAKVFKAVANIVEAVVNVLSAIFAGGEEGTESTMTKGIKVIASFLSWFLDFVLAASEILVALTEGDISGALKILTDGIQNVFGDLVEGIKTAVMGTISGIATSISDMFWSMVDSINPFSGGGGGDEGDSGTEVRLNRYGKEYSKGGMVKHYATGGSVSGAGTGTSDDIPAMLSNGEFVMNAKSAKKFMPLLEAMNKNKMATGGPVGNTSSGGYSADTTRILAQLREVESYFSAGDLAESLDAYMDLDHVSELFDDFVSDFSSNDFAETLNDMVSKVSDLDILDALNENLLEFINDAGHELEYFKDTPTNDAGAQESVDTSRIMNSLREVEDYFSAGDLAESLDAYMDLDHVRELFQDFISEFSVNDFAESLNGQVSAESDTSLLDTVNEKLLEFVNNAGHELEYFKEIPVMVDNLTQSITNAVFSSEEQALAMSGIHAESITAKVDETDAAKTASDAIIALAEASTQTVGAMASARSNLSQVQQSVTGTAMKSTSESISGLGKTVRKSSKTLRNEFSGMGQAFSGPIKNALKNGGSIGDGVKEGLKNMLQKVADKLMDQAFAPMEEALDNMFSGGGVGGLETQALGGEPTGSMVDPIYTKDTGEGMGFGTDQDSLMVGQNQLAESKIGFGNVTSAITKQTTDMPGLFDNLGSIFDSGLDSLGGLFGGMGGPAGSGGGGGIMSLFGGGGGGGGGMGSIGGMLAGFAKGGIVPELGMKPQYFASGGMARGTDTVPAMLTPGEMVLTKEQQMGMMGEQQKAGDTYNFNIEATDAQSFKKMLSQDPKFLHNIAQRGQKATSGLRRTN